MARMNIIVPALAVLAGLALSSIYIVDERERALVLQFGEVKVDRSQPGYGFKIPLIQSVVRYDKRILSLSTPPIEVTPLDDRRLVVDAFARWRITDAIAFREAVSLSGPESLRAAETRLAGIIENAIREVLGSVPSTTVLSDDRTPLMNQIRDLARKEAAALGVDVIDVRLTRTDLPEQNLAATFDRMRAERDREARDETRARRRGGTTRARHRRPDRGRADL